MLTYGDGLTNLNLNKLYKFHKKNKKIATMTIVHPPARFGEVQCEKNVIKSFKENHNYKRAGLMEDFLFLNLIFLSF